MKNLTFAGIVILCLAGIFYAYSVLSEKSDKKINDMFVKKFELVRYTPDSSSDLTKDIELLARRFGTDTVAHEIYKKWAVQCQGFVKKSNLKNGDMGSAIYNIAEAEDFAEMKKRMKQYPDGYELTGVSGDDMSVSLAIEFSDSKRKPLIKDEDKRYIILFEPKVFYTADTAKVKENFSRLVLAIPENVWSVIENTQCKRDCDNIVPYFVLNSSIAPNTFVQFLNVKPVSKDAHMFVNEYVQEEIVDAYWSHFKSLRG